MRFATPVDRIYGDMKPRNSVLLANVGEHVDGKSPQPMFARVVACEDIFQAHVGMSHRGLLQTSSQGTRLWQMGHDSAQGPGSIEVQSCQVN